MSKTISPSTYVRNLSPGLLRQLADFLDPQEGWKRLAVDIKKSSGESRYTQFHIRRFEGVIQKGKSPTHELLYDWGTTNCTVQDLGDLLRRNEFLTAASLFPCAETATRSRCQTLPMDELQAPQTTFETSSKTEYGNPVSESTEAEENDEETSGFGIFSFNQLKRITRDFDDRPLSDGGCKIGEGGFGVVFQGHLKGEKVAVKKLTTMADASLQELQDQFEQEIKTMARCHHENIVKLLGFSNDGASYCLVYTFMSNGSLLDRLACVNSTDPLSWSRRCSIVLGTAHGIKYLHENNHVHRDIKSANILLDDSFTPKISDFGLARATGHLARTMMTERIVGTTAYMAPEALRGEVTIKSDIFSFGVVLLEIISGLAPCDEDRNPALLLDIKEEIEEEEKTLEEYVDIKMEDAELHVIEKMYCISSQCLNQIKNKRPNINTVLHDLGNITCIHSGS
ncbi:interleukin-1 receptor-associated kinase 4 isoform X1 [Bufo gargarizans]|uniref:interleukin-1 receptor-associated kinase 4 isoform X1 n=1 Tax=Bufo gargarizans TaxID=30331 RepID=UPI001CF44D5D|nr:interleukin-1 receptor-associated kinase 4 isoform X1 [Bufo gargarizans]